MKQNNNLKIVRLIIIFTFLLVTSITSGQTKTISGKIIDENLTDVALAKIQTDDSSFFATSEFNGRFKIEVSINTKSLLISSVGFERARINLPDTCNQLDIILMSNVTYDYISLKKVDKFRMKRFKELPKIHMTAFQKGIFTTDKSCYTQRFISN